MTGCALVFDLDDTLYRERGFALSGYAAVARHVEKTTGVPAQACFRSLVAALRHGRRAYALQDACEACGLDASAVAEWLAVYRAHEPRLRLPGGSRRLLQRLRPRWRLGVLTNGMPRVQRAKVQSLRIEPLVDAVVYAAEHGSGVGKPEAAPFVEVLARLGVTPDRAVVVGDDPVCDIAGARAVGMRAVWLRGRRDRDGRRVAADAVIESLSELPAALGRLGLAEGQYAH